jgi:spore coat protein CotH
MVKKFAAHRNIVLSRLIICFIITGVFLASENTFANAKNPDGLVFESSNLAIVVINTNGQTITSNARIPASMGIIYNENGTINYLTDPFNVYNGQIAIEIRGHSSKGFDQKSYRIETLDTSGFNNNVPLLGMPKDNDWVIYGPYNDKSLIRNALVYSLAGEINAYAPRTRFCELILNGSYQGVYLLIEKIKQQGKYYKNETC